MITFAQFLKEAPQYYPGPVTYQKDSKFTPISRGNISSYDVLGEYDGLLYLVDPQNSTGFVFDVNDLKTDSAFVTPVLRLLLRDSGIEGLRQAYQLRIKERYARKNVASTWYKLYTKQRGGIVSDIEHLEGGKNLWKSFLLRPGEFNISLYNLDTKQYIPITPSTVDHDIWSIDGSKRNIVLVLKKNGSE